MNTYRSDIDLFISGETLSSQEGDYSALIERISNDDVKQSLYADDATAGGILSGLRKWWDDLAKIGPNYGYFPNTKKTSSWLKITCLQRPENCSRTQVFMFVWRVLAIWEQPLACKASFLQSFMQGQS